MRILTYKRTHTGDPDRLGRFGINDCMGSVRNLRFDAVIGVGVGGVEPRKLGIARKLTWIGVGPRRSSGRKCRRGDIVTFDRLLLLDADGPELRSVAPNLARRIYCRRTRFVLDAYSADERAEALALRVRAVGCGGIADPQRLPWPTQAIEGRYSPPCDHCLSARGDAIESPCQPILSIR